MQTLPLRFLTALCAALVLWSAVVPTAQAQARARRLPGIEAPGALPLHIYPADAHPGSPSNWAVTVGPDGHVFVGNGKGVYTIRGAHMSNLVPLANKGVVRAIEQGPDGRMYVGGSNELGYLTPTAQGTLRYTSLLSHVPESQRDFQDVWLVRTFGDAVFFYTHHQLMRWVPATGTMKVWRFEQATVLVRGASEPMLQTLGEGALHRLVGDEWRPFFVNAAVLGQQPVRLLMPRPGGDSLVVTERGLYRLRDGRLRAQASALDAGDQRRSVYDAAALPGGDLAVATLYEGVLFLDANGTLIRSLSKVDGLPDNVALALAYDEQGHLWVALERGLVRVDLGSGVTVLHARQGLNADAEALALHDGELYLGGIEQMAHIALTPGGVVQTKAAPEDDVLALASTPQGVLVGMRKGLGVYRNGAMEPVPGFEAVGDYPTALLRSRVDTTRLYVGYRSGLATLELRQGRWVLADSLTAVRARVTAIAEEADGTLWLGSYHEDLWRVRFGAGAPDVQRYGPAEGMPRLTVTPLRVQDEVLVYTSEGFFRPQGARVVRDSSALAAALAFAPRDIADAFVADDGDVYLVVDGQPGVARWAGAQYRWEPLVDATVQRQATLRSWWLGGAWWLGQTNRLVRVQPGLEAEAAFNTHIELIRTAATDSLLYGGYGTPRFSHLSARDGLELVVGAPRYGGVQYRYRLDGLDGRWSAWTDSPQRSYLTLPAGHYVFRAQARDRYGNVGREASHTFTVVPLWYWSRGMLIIYVVVALLLVLACVAGATRWQERRSEAARRLLKAKVRVHTREAEAQKRMLRYLNKTLQESNTQLEEMSAQKSRLLSIAAHDLKTPIANIYSLADILLEEREEGPPNYEFLDLIRTSARQMSTLIDDVLNAEARETGQLRIRPVHTDLRLLAHRSVQQCIGLADAKGQTIRLHVVPEAGAFETSVDELRIIEAMTNLVGNAVKYSRLGAGIEVHVTRAAGVFRFEVRDQGPGIRDDERDGLFQPFQRLSAQPTGGESSSGMGLYIVRQYVEMHQGAVGVESLPDVGSIFWFTLPAPEQGAMRAATPEGAESGSPA